MSWHDMPPNYPPGLRPPKPPPPKPPTQAPEKVRLAQGNLYVDRAFICLEDVALFDGARTVRFKNGSERELPEALAVALRAYCAFMHRRITPLD